MIPTWLRKLVLAAALAVMPLQGIAATLSLLLCHGEAQAHAQHAGASHNHDAHHDAHDHQAGNDAAGGSIHHLCCHFTVTAPVTVLPAVTPPDFPVLALAPSPLHDRFVPDRPQRPPLS